MFYARVLRPCFATHRRAPAGNTAHVAPWVSLRGQGNKGELGCNERTSENYSRLQGDLQEFIPVSVPASKNCAPKVIKLTAKAVGFYAEDVAKYQEKWTPLPQSANASVENVRVADATGDNTAAAAFGSRQTRLQTKGCRSDFTQPCRTDSAWATRK